MYSTATKMETNISILISTKLLKINIPMFIGQTFWQKSIKLPSIERFLQNKPRVFSRFTDNSTPKASEEGNFRSKNKTSNMSNSTRHVKKT